MVQNVGCVFANFGGRHKVISGYSFVAPLTVNLFKVKFKLNRRSINSSKALTLNRLQCIIALVAWCNTPY